MSARRISLFGALVVGALVVAPAGCSSNSVTGGTDSNTHWVTCTTDTDCRRAGSVFDCVEGHCGPGPDASMPVRDAGKASRASSTPSPGAGAACSDCDANGPPAATCSDCDAGALMCPLVPEPACSLTHGCPPTWRDVGIAQCNGLLLNGTPYRCGPYDALLVQYEDTGESFFYGADGKLVGDVHYGVDCSPTCAAYDPSFALRLTPPSPGFECPGLLPACVQQSSAADCDAEAPPELFDAGPPDDCKSCLPGGTLLWGDVTSAAPLSTVYDSSITCRTYHHALDDGGECNHAVGDCNDIVITQLEDIWAALESPSLRTALALGARFGSAGTTAFEVKNDFGSFTVSDPCSPGERFCVNAPSEVVGVADTLRAYETLMLQNHCGAGQQ